jgi:hypothetical protein
MPDKPFDADTQWHGAASPARDMRLAAQRRCAPVNSNVSLN